MRRVLVPLAWIWAVGLSLAWVGAAVDYPDEVLVEFGIPAVLFLAVGVLLATRVPHNLIGPTLLLGSSAWLIYDIGQAYAAASLARGPYPFDYLAAWLGAWTGPLAFLMIPALLVMFPDGRFTGRRRWFLPLFGVVLTMIGVGAVLLWGLPIADLIDDIAISGVAAYEWVDLAYPLSWMLAIPAALSLIVRYRRSSPVERQQTKWFLAAVIFAPLVGAIGIWLLPERWHGLVIAVAISLLPVAIGVAVLRFRLYDLGRVISRTVSYALVVGVIGLVFAIGVVYIPNQLMGTDAPPWLVAASTLAAAALFNPVRRRVVGWVERRFNRSHYDAERVIDAFTTSLRDRVDALEIVEDWRRIVVATMAPTAAGVWVRE
jgi:hypothetical protein